MRDIQIETKDKQKDLGTLISSDLKTTKYCIEVEKNAISYYDILKDNFSIETRKL